MMNTEPELAELEEEDAVLRPRSDATIRNW
jgi:hypothetical protein